ncbi:uncharacterized protein LOC110900815 [Helianthus annuus]|uniref:uncharacterized protein LOC110900815 n=1 Tax=Helianthus annuus TaxID=4232 RepID=UPI000B8EFF9D|nr:uncharacterized protein LOC110900815 [Helianthus annuus]
MLLADFNRVRPDYVVKRNNWIPKKVGMVAWRAYMERLPTRVALQRRGITIHNLECILCREYCETSDHLLVSSGFAQIVWLLVFQWCKTDPIIAFSLRDILDAHQKFGGSDKKKKAFHVVCLVTLWSIWNLRNDLMFVGKTKSIANVVEEIKVKSFIWVKHRAKEVNMSWDQWRVFDVF